jgi:DNA-binding NtrC family response regulator
LETALFGSSPADGQPSAPDTPGVLEQADGGTLFLHNIDAMPAALQGRLVRTLERSHLGVRDQSGVRRRSVRIIAATRKNAQQLIDQAEFRADLHRHLNGSCLAIPTLCERPTDLPLLADHFVSRTSRKEGRLPCRLAPDALAALEAHAWPGNVAELENVIERACLLNSGEVLTAGDIQPWLGTNTTTADLGTTVGMTLGEMERKLIEATFQRFGGNREKTAKALDIGVRTLCGKLREYGYPPRGGPGSNLAVREARVA